MNKQLSQYDIEKIVNKPINIFEYKNLDNVNINKFLAIPSIILYESKEGNHWTAIIPYDNTIEFYDSYGLCPDCEFHFMKDQSPHFLSNILDNLHEKGFNIIYNKYSFQKKGKTCGRWVALRIKNSNLNLAQFINKYKNLDDNDIAKNEI